VGTENQLVVKDYPDPKSAAGAAPALANATGTWSGGNGNYKLEFSVGGTEFKPTAVIEGDRMTVTVDRAAAVVFDREY